jgi:hypothetical protein
MWPDLITEVIQKFIIFSVPTGRTFFQIYALHDFLSFLAIPDFKE